MVDVKLDKIFKPCEDCNLRVVFFPTSEVRCENIVRHASISFHILFIVLSIYVVRPCLIAWLFCRLDCWDEFRCCTLLIYFALLKFYKLLLTFQKMLLVFHFNR